MCCSASAHSSCALSPWGYADVRDSHMNIVSWFFGLTTVVGLVLTIYYNHKSARLEIARKKIGWADLQSCANDLGSEIKKSFQPDVMFTPGLRGATFANLLVEEFEKDMPVLVGVTSWKTKPGAVSACPTFLSIATNKWYIHIPECLMSFKGCRVLIVDDFAMSGDFLEQVKKLLISHGFEDKNIKTVCMATTKVAEHNHKAPDYSWMQVADDDFYFPWGKAK